LDLPQPSNKLVDSKEKTKACQEGELDLLKLERQLDKLKTLVEDKQQMAIQGQALFNEANNDCRILEQELDKCLLQLLQSQKELENIQI